MWFWCLPINRPSVNMKHGCDATITAQSVTKLPKIEDLTVSSVIENYHAVRASIDAALAEAGRDSASLQLVAVSKTHTGDHIAPVIAAGHRVFGENRVQEAAGKWPALRETADDICLHLIGPLQSNKAEQAVGLFDVVETVDREKIARALANAQQKLERRLRYYVQVNTGLEPQKAGIAPDQTAEFVALCRGELGLDIEGLMCIPPVDENPGPHFALLRKLAEANQLPRLSMGMSGDYETAIGFGATSVRIGSAIFGARNTDN